MRTWKIFSKSSLEHVKFLSCNNFHMSLTHVFSESDSEEYQSHCCYYFTGSTLCLLNF